MAKESRSDAMTCSAVFSNRVAIARKRFRLTKMADYCCDRMRADLEHVCDIHSDRSECPDALIGRTKHGFGLLVHDGGSSMISIAYCPWCGARLPSTHE